MTAELFGTGHAGRAAALSAPNPPLKSRIMLCLYPASLVPGPGKSQPALAFYLTNRLPSFVP